MKRSRTLMLIVALAAAAAAITGLIHSRYARDLAAAAARAAEGSTLVATACGPIEVQQAGSGVPVLMIHGSGGGHDQGMAFARTLVPHGRARDCDVALRLPAHAAAGRCVA